MENPGGELSFKGEKGWPDSRAIIRVCELEAGLSRLPNLLSDNSHRN